VRPDARALGYQRLKENVTNGKADNHEGLDFYAPVADPDPTRPLHGENQWPTQPTDFRAAYERWAAKMQVLGMCVMRACVARPVAPRAEC
jgi:isopenicillin N synthase-like dioxygenase